MQTQVCPSPGPGWALQPRGSGSGRPCALLPLAGLPLRRPHRDKPDSREAAQGRGPDEAGGKSRLRGRSSAEWLCRRLVHGAHPRAPGHPHWGRCGHGAGSGQGPASVQRRENSGAGTRVPRKAAMPGGPRCLRSGGKGSELPGLLICPPSPESRQLSQQRHDFSLSGTTRWPVGGKGGGPGTAQGRGHDPQHSRNPSVTFDHLKLDDSCPSASSGGGGSGTTPQQVLTPLVRDGANHSHGQPAAAAGSQLRLAHPASRDPRSVESTGVRNPGTRGAEWVLSEKTLRPVGPRVVRTPAARGSAVPRLKGPRGCQRRAGVG